MSAVDRTALNSNMWGEESGGRTAVHQMGGEEGPVAISVLPPEGGGKAQSPLVFRLQRAERRAQSPLLFRLERGERSAQSPLVCRQ